MHVTESDEHIIELTESPEFVTQFLFDGANRGVLIPDDDIISVMNFGMEGRFKYTKLAERITHNHKGFLLRKNSFFYEAFNRKLEQLVESGIARKLVDQAMNLNEEKESDDGPVVLTLEHLGVGFKITLLFLLISFVVFLLEFVAVFCRRTVEH